MFSLHIKICPNNLFFIIKVQQWISILVKPLKNFYWPFKCI